MILLGILLTRLKHLGASLGMVQQLYFCVFHVMGCIQTERAKEPRCLKTSAPPHKARPTELQQTLYLMAAKMHIVIHLEPAAPDVNKQYNFIALLFHPHPPPTHTHTLPPPHSPQPILGLYSLFFYMHPVILGLNLLADSLSSTLSVTACFVLSSEVSIVMGSYKKRGLA